MFEILGYIVLAVLMYRLIEAWVWYSKFKHAIEEAVEEELTKEEMDKKVRIFELEYVEQNGFNVVLVYDKNNKFITQGNNQVEVDSILRNCYPTQAIVTINKKATVDQN